jgi:lipoprotein-releasing system ATP-binding protein
VGLVLKAEGICKSFLSNGGGQVVLNDLSMQLNSGEVVALLGPSGCGKSTLLQICGLLSGFDSGTITILGEDFSSYNESAATLMRLHNIGYIYQFHHLLPEFNILENVMMPLLIAKTSRQIAEFQAMQISTRLGLKDKIYSMPAELSGGQQQRVAIARALVHEPKLVLADEPTGNLDEQNSQIVLEELTNLAQEKNIAVLLVTHNLELAKKADRILTMTNGCIKSEDVNEHRRSKANKRLQRGRSTRKKNSSQSTG